MKEWVAEGINSWFTDIFTDMLNFFLGLFGSLIDSLSENVELVETWYTIFVAMVGVLIVAVVMVRIFFTLLSEGERASGIYGMEPTISIILMDSIKACGAIPVMVFAQGLLQDQIIFPIVKWLFDEQSMFSAETITDMGEVGGVILSGFSLILFILFFAVVLGVFFFKMCKFYANLVFFTLGTPFVAMTMVTEDFNLFPTWWRKLLYMNLSLVAQVMSLTMMVWAITRPDITIQYFLLAIGSGILVMSAPALIKDFWSSSGTSRKAMQGMSMMIRKAVSR